MKTHNCQGPAFGRRHSRGLSLIELMISLVLGLLVVGAAISVFFSNGQTYRATESLGRVQENARVAFELMAHDVREAAGNPCGRNLPMANTIENASSQWFTNFSDGVRGVEGAFAQANPANRVAGTDAIELLSGEGMGISVVSHNPTSAQFKLSSADHDFVADDVLMACDNRQAAIFQMTGPNATNATSVHNTGTGSIGNCTKALGVPVVCGCAGPTCNHHDFGANSMLVKLRAIRWYVGTNGRGENSLYRTTLRVGATAPEEITEGVEDMQITYLLPGETSYVDAATVGVRWKEVLAARIDVSLEGAERVGTAGEVIERQLTHVVTLRNRNL